MPGNLPEHGSLVLDGNLQRHGSLRVAGDLNTNGSHRVAGNLVLNGSLLSVGWASFIMAHSLYRKHFGIGKGNHLLVTQV